MTFPSISSTTLPALLLSLCLGAAATAQNEETAEKQDKPTEAPATPVAKPKVDPQDPAGENERNLKAAREELAYIRRLVKTGLVKRAQSRYFSNRTQQPRTVELGVNALAREQQVTNQPDRFGPRLMDADELGNVAEDVVFTVNGQPVSNAEYEAMYTHVASDRGEMTDDAVAKVTVKNLTLQKSALAVFAANAEERRQEIGALQAKLEAGEDFAEVARGHSQCPSASQGGDLGFFQRGMMDPIFEKTAWELPAGSTSGVVQSAFGYHLIKVTEREVGEQPGTTKRVRASHILVMFDKDQQLVRKIMGDAASGAVDLAFRNAEWLKRSPF